jgi:hypothetical protein
MSTPTNLSPEEFMKEIKQWGATKDSNFKVRMMKKGDFVFCRLTLPHNGETIQTRVTLDRFREFEWINLAPISIPAVWNDEFDELSKINKNIEELNASTITSNKNYSLWHR